MTPETVKQALEPYEQIVWDNVDSFIDTFCQGNQTMDLVKVRFSSGDVEFVYVLMSGQHIVNSVPWSEFLEWMKSQNY